MLLIDADAIVEDIEDYLYDDDELAYSKNREFDRGYNNGLKCAIRRIKWKASALDAVPVVRCKDCKHHDAWGWCAELERGTAEEAFCAYGERKER